MKPGSGRHAARAHPLTPHPISVPLIPAPQAGLPHKLPLCFLPRAASALCLQNIPWGSAACALALLTGAASRPKGKERPQSADAATGPRLGAGAEFFSPTIQKEKAQGRVHQLPTVGPGWMENGRRWALPPGLPACRPRRSLWNGGPSAPQREAPGTTS